MAKLSPEAERYVEELKMMDSKTPVKGDVAFEIAWHYYPLKIGKKAAKRRFLKTVKTKRDYDRTVEAHNRYMDYLGEKRRGGFKIGIQHGSTFFNNWEDWVDDE